MSQIKVSGLDITKGTLNAINVTANAITPFGSLISGITVLISEIIQVYDAAQCNKRICNALLDRVQSAEFALNLLKRRKQENEANFRKEKYYHSFLKFELVLQQIKEFAKEVTQLQGFEKIFKANTVSKTFTQLTNDFDEVMKDLNFTMAISSDEQRKIDQESLKEDLDEMKEDILTTNLTQYFEQVSIMNKLILTKANDGTSIINKIQVRKIASNELKDPFPGRKEDLQGVTKKKIFKDYLDVACKPVTLPKEGSQDSPKILLQLAILEKLSNGPSILQFYGLSYIDNNNVMVSEWAEYGSLKEVYEKYDIMWCRKILLALDICRGIGFLQSAEIFHHNIRCENVMITQNLEPKLTNFQYAREITGETSQITNISTIVHWLAPEKMRDHGYTYKCELFSFGMLLWELCYEKIPYENLETKDIMDHVRKGKREKLLIGRGKQSEDKEIQKEFAGIINETWYDEPQMRISISALFLELSKLKAKYVKAGVKLHGKGDKESRRQAWKCFVANADLGNPIAKFWKGYYLSKGYVEDKNLEEAKKLFKEAADYGFAAAQFQYAVTLVDDQEKRMEFLKYLQLSADQGNTDAEYTLGRLYLTGSIVNVDRETGLNYLKLATLNDHKEARELLKNENIDI
ncbi:kinase-like domain-containing protein [Gigaspora rosea]|uniref:Kinase-like domain-containing protein n=1 Tax=Gigaspora rosea TaxID=44941 RepID=A0A397TYB8_9GLOM|nr:kinase-like domain-containing protein [Gigaspora rosea]